MRKRLFSFYKGPLKNTVPCATYSVEDVYELITSDNGLGEATLKYRAIPPDNKKARRAEKAKQPYITPLGVFQRRLDTALITPSGLLVLDMDELESYEKACELRDSLFSDRALHPELTYVSMSGLGVKALVPYRISPYEPLVETIKRAYEIYWSYIEYTYGGRFLMKIDRCGDLSRACSLCFDADARIKI